MKLSEAIRAGAQLRPQAFGTYADAGRTDALGAAYEALTGAPPPDFGALVPATLDALATWTGWLAPTVCSPIPEDVEAEVWGAVTYLNDEARWTREAIADWLEGQGL